MPNFKPLLSVAIPTHNRSQYAVHAIRSLLKIEDSRLEIVVTDTSTDGMLERAITCGGEFRDRRLKYLRPTGILGMTENHNAALAAAEGRYVTLIGDDDSISSEALKVAEWAETRNVEAVAPRIVANYVWPDFRSRFFGEKHASRLYFAKNASPPKWELSALAMAASFKSACQGTDLLPKIYHGIVSAQLLSRLRSTSGAYFHGSSPDVSGAVGLALLSQSFLTVTYPVTLPGASGGSNTGRSAMNTHKGKLAEERQTQQFIGEGWSPGVPRFFSVETVWAHAALETSTRIIGAAAVQRQFGYAELLGVCRVLHPEFSAEVEAAMREVADFSGEALSALERRTTHHTRAFRARRLKATLCRLSRPTAAGGRDFVGGLATVDEATRELNRYLEVRQMDWNKYVTQFKTDLDNPHLQHSESQQATTVPTQLQNK